MKVQELLNSPDKWTQRVPARNENEKVVLSDSMDAVKWCLMGAIWKCYPLEITEVVNKIRKKVKTNVPDFNDGSSYEEVMEVVRELDI